MFKTAVIIFTTFLTATAFPANRSVTTHKNSIADNVPTYSPCDIATVYAKIAATYATAAVLYNGVSPRIPQIQSAGYKLILKTHDETEHAALMAAHANIPSSYTYQNPKSAVTDVNSAALKVKDMAIKTENALIEHNFCKTTTNHNTHRALQLAQILTDTTHYTCNQVKEASAKAASAFEYAYLGATTPAAFNAAESANSHEETILTASNRARDAYCFYTSSLTTAADAFTTQVAHIAHNAFDVAKSAIENHYLRIKAIKASHEAYGVDHAKAQEFVRAASHALAGSCAKASHMYQEASILAGNAITAYTKAITILEKEL